MSARSLTPSLIIFLSLSPCVVVLQGLTFLKAARTIVIGVNVAFFVRYQHRTHTRRTVHRRGPACRYVGRSLEFDASALCLSTRLLLVVVVLLSSLRCWAS